MILGLGGLTLGGARPAAGGGGGGGATPAWVQTLQALVADPSDLLFAYNFASGGTGQGWDGTNNVTLTAAQAMAATSFGSWDVSNIVDGLGLAPLTGTTIVGATPLGIIPEAAFRAGTILLETRAYAPVTVDTRADVLGHFVDNPGDNTDGGIDINIGGTDPGVSSALFRSWTGSVRCQDAVDPQPQIMRAANTYDFEDTVISGSVNGQAVVTGTATTSELSMDSVYIQTRALSDPSTDVQVYGTLLAILKKQLVAQLPTISAVA